MPIIRWYWDMTNGQRRLCWIVSAGCVLLLGIGLAMLAFLLYCHLGRERYISEMLVKGMIVNAALNAEANVK